MLVSNKKSHLTAIKKYSLWRIVYILVFATLVFGLAFTGYFIYKTVYIGIANANALVSTGLANKTYNLDIIAFEKSASAIAQKKQLEKFPANTRNIFDYTQTTSTYASSSTPL